MRFDQLWPNVDQFDQSNGLIEAILAPTKIYINYL